MAKNAREVSDLREGGNECEGRKALGDAYLDVEQQRKRAKATKTLVPGAREKG